MPPHGRLGMLVALVAACLLLAPASALEPNAVGMAIIDPATPDYLQALDSNFVGEYEGFKTLETSSRPLIVIATADDFRLFRYGNLSDTVPVDSRLYHAMKTYLHATLALYGTCRAWGIAGQGGRPELGAAGKAASLDKFKAAMAAALQMLGQDPILNATQKAAVEEILRQYLSIADAAASNGYSARECVRGMRSQKGAVMAMVNQTGEQHWKALQDAIAKVKEGASQEEWDNILVAVPTGSTPQKMNIEYGAWLHALGDGAASTRVFTAINTSTDDGVLAALATKYDDGQLATDFFGNSTRMWEDLFADVSEQHVGEVYSGF